MGIKNKLINLKNYEKNYRSILTSIQLAVPGDNGKIIVFSSAYSGEGVTNTAINLARIIAMEKKTLFVEANIERPSISSLLDLPQEIGLVDMLTNGLEIQKAIKYKKDMNNLAVITAGIQKTSSHYLALPAWKEILQYMRNNFEVIFIDVPPIIQNNDTSVLASLCDGLILVIESDKTRREVIQRSKNILVDSNVKILGSIISKRQFTIPKFIYKRL